MNCRRMILLGALCVALLGVQEIAVAQRRDGRNDGRGERMKEMRDELDKSQEKVENLEYAVKQLQEQAEDRARQLEYQTVDQRPYLEKEIAKLLERVKELERENARLTKMAAAGAAPAALPVPAVAKPPEKTAARSFADILEQAKVLKLTEPFITGLQLRKGVEDLGAWATKQKIIGGAVDWTVALVEARDAPAKDRIERLTWDLQDAVSSVTYAKGALKDELERVKTAVEPQRHVYQERIKQRQAIIRACEPRVKEYTRALAEEKQYTLQVIATVSGDPDAVIEARVSLDDADFLATVPVQGVFRLRGTVSRIRCDREPYETPRFAVELVRCRAAAK